MSGTWDEQRPPAGPVAGEGNPSSRDGAAGGSPSPAPPADQRSAQDAAQSSSPDEGAAEAVEQDLQQLLVDAEAKRDEYLELARRTQADFENYRKRVANDLKAAAQRGKAELAREVIDAVDNLERALEAAGENGGAGLGEGVRMVLGGLQETLRRHGVEPLDPTGEKFDPQWHEALSTLAVEGSEPGLVVETMQKGYRMDEQLIRPARVVVSA